MGDGLGSNGRHPPMYFKDREAAAAAGRIGGKVVTPKQRLAARIAALRRRGNMNDADAQRLYNLMIDPSMSALDVAIMIDRMRTIAIENPDLKNFETVINSTAKWHKMHFGDKLKVESTNINIDLQLPEDQVVDLLDLLTEQRG